MNNRKSLTPSIFISEGARTASFVLDPLRGIVTITFEQKSFHELYESFFASLVELTREGH